jgi:3-phenylpropionate/trans-cinnamate dioxygenase ferredoxin component
VSEFIRVASIADLPPNALRGVSVNGTAVCLANADGTIYAFQDNCSHKDFPLHSGTLAGCRLECAWHGGTFDLESGRAVRLPAVKPIRMYDVRIEGDDILVAV